MARSGNKLGKQLQNIRGRVSRALAYAAVGGATIIELEAKANVQKKGHIRTGNLLRGISTQVGEVTPTEATAVVGAAPEYASNVEELPVGPRIPRSLTPSGRIINRGEGGGFFFIAVQAKTAAAVAEAGRRLEAAMREGARR